MGRQRSAGVSAPAAVGLAIFLLLAGASPLAAEPYIAVREGLKCDFCHVNKTGGGKRTEAFAATADTFLHTSPPPPPADRVGQLTWVLGGQVSLGANLRFTNLTLFRDDPDAQGLVPKDQVFRPLESNDFLIDEGVAYLEAALIADRLTFYLDESFAPGAAVSRETFGLLTGFLPGGGYIKAGRFFAPFGLRIEDDNAFIRSMTGFNFNNSSEGLEVGLSTGSVFLAAAVVNSDQLRGDNTRKQVSANGYYLHHFGGPLKTVLLGGSVAHNPSTDRSIYGLHAGASFWRLTVLTEGDWIRDDLPQRNIDRRVAYAEVNWLASDRVNVKFAYDYFDPDDSVAENHRERYSLGLESFLYRHLQARLFYRVVTDIPQNPSGNINELMAEMHVFF